jgi:hypothetical protein
MFKNYYKPSDMSEDLVESHSAPLLKRYEILALYWGEEGWLLRSEEVTASSSFDFETQI